MKLMYLTPSIGLGSETFIADLLAGLAQRLGPFDVVCNSASEASQSPRHCLRVHKVPFLALTRPTDRVRIRLQREPFWVAGPAAGNTLYDRQARRILAPIIARLGPDVAFLEYGSTLSRCAPVLTAVGVPMVVHLHGHDVTAALADEGYRDALARALKCAAKVIVASRHMARLAVLAGAPEDRVRVIRLGVEVESVSPMPWSERRCRAPSAVFLGRMVPKKNPVALIEAFRLVAAKRLDARLHIIGEGPELPRALARAEEHGLREAVVFHGALARQKALTIVREQWVYAQHSVTAFDGDQEGFGLSVAEAAALALPVVSTRHNGITEQVINGETGYLVPEYAYDEMAARLLDLFADSDLCERLGNAGRQHILSRHQTARRVDEIVEVLQAVQQSRN